MLKNSSISIVCLCLLAGCAGRHVRVERRPTVCEARMDRVPFPCGVRVQELSGTPAGAATGSVTGALITSKMWEFETKLSPQALHEFYFAQTELEGWRQVSAYFTASGDLILVYQRPGRLLVIDGRQRGRRLLVRCFMGPDRK